MSSLLFDVHELSNARATIINAPRCGECGLFKGCLSPKMPVWGEGKKQVLIVGEAPGKEEDKANRPFIGPAGRLLREFLARIEVDLDRDCWVTNSLSCRPPENATPTNKQLDYCLPLVLKTIKNCNPKTVVLLGGSAISSVIGHFFGKDSSGVNKWAGFKIPLQDPNCWVCPTYHPASIIYRRDEAKERPMEELFFMEHLKNAFNLKNRPWQSRPTYSDRITIMGVDYPGRFKMMGDENQTNIAIKSFIGNKPVAFDYETDRLKPDSKGSSIISCSMDDGERCISFPWSDGIRSSMREFLFSNTPKIGWNAKMEERWTIEEFGKGVRNWISDGMLTAHGLDNRPGIKSLKFQAFVWLGQVSYDAEVQKYFEAPTVNSPNNIRELCKTPAGWKKLLYYGGLDAVLEWELWQVQQRQLRRCK